MVSVRDLDARAGAIEEIGARVTTVGGARTRRWQAARRLPAGSGRFRDRVNQPTPLPAPTDTAGNVFGSAFEVAIRDTDTSVAFYRNLLTAFRPSSDRLSAETS